MNALDLVVLVAILIAAFGGYRLGFLSRVLSWIGLAGGLYVALRFLPQIVRWANLRTSTDRLILSVVVLLGAALVGQAIGLTVGFRLHRELPLGPLRGLDSVIGAAVGALGVLVMLWLLVPALSAAPGWPSNETRGSAIARWVSGLPAPPNTLGVLRRLVGNDPFPQVFNSLEQGGPVGSPPASNPLGKQVGAAVEASTVKVQGQACDRIQDGSGFTVAPDLVVTNAHVVAGEPAGGTSVQLPSGRWLTAKVVLYDPNRDLALLQVPGLGEPSLSLGTPQVGELTAVFGHPGGQRALAVMPATVAQKVLATGKDLYNRHNTTRQVLVLASRLAPGDSGSPVVDRAGQVVGVAFAIATNQSATAYALNSSELQAVLQESRGPTVSTEGCLSD